MSSRPIDVAWGRRGLDALRPRVDALVVVDVLSFSTAVTMTVARGAVVYPCTYSDDRARRLAARVGAVVAGRRGEPTSLSPAAIAAVPRGLRLVLPSPNGSTLASMAGDLPVFAGCLRNASAVARACHEHCVGVVAAGERWPDGALRPALEDWLGAGAVLDALATTGGEPSADARAAIAAWREARPELEARLLACASGVELVERGFHSDVVLSAAHDVDDVVPRLSRTEPRAFTG